MALVEDVRGWRVGAQLNGRTSDDRRYFPGGPVRLSFHPQWTEDRTVYAVAKEVSQKPLTMTVNQNSLSLLLVAILLLLSLANSEYEVPMKKAMPPKLDPIP